MVILVVILVIRLVVILVIRLVIRLVVMLVVRLVVRLVPMHANMLFELYCGMVHICEHKWTFRVLGEHPKPPHTTSRHLVFDPRKSLGKVCMLGTP